MIAFVPKVLPGYRFGSILKTSTTNPQSTVYQEPGPQPRGTTGQLLPKFSKHAYLLGTTRYNHFARPTKNISWLPS